MTLDEAVRVLVGYLNNADGVVSPKLPEAMGLGVEALKRIKDIRREISATRESLLPGETEEEQPTRDEVRRYMLEQQRRPIKE